MLACGLSLCIQGDDICSLAQAYCTDGPSKCLGNAWTLGCPLDSVSGYLHGHTLPGWQYCQAHLVFLQVGSYWLAIGLLADT